MQPSECAFPFEHEVEIEIENLILPIAKSTVSCSLYTGDLPVACIPPMLKRKQNLNVTTSEWQ